MKEVEGGGVGEGRRMSTACSESSTVPEVDLNTSTGLYDGLDEDEEVFESSAPPSIKGEEVDLYDHAVMGMGMMANTRIQGESSSSSSKEESCGGGVRGRGGGGSQNTERKKGEDEEEDEGISSLSQKSEGGSGNDGESMGRGGGGGSQTVRKHALYIGNLTWWTTHEDIKKAVGQIGVEDVLDIKIFECRSNGQSKGFCYVTFGSEESTKGVVEQFEKVEVHGRYPIVKPDSKVSMQFFDSQSKTRPPSTSGIGVVATTNQLIDPHAPRHNVYLGNGSSGNGNRYGNGVRQQANGTGGGGQFSSSRGYNNRNPMTSPRYWGPTGQGAVRNNGHNLRFPPSFPPNGFNYGPRYPPPMAYVPAVDGWRPGAPYVHKVHYNPAFLNRSSGPGPMVPSPSELDYPPPSVFGIGTEESYAFNPGLTPVVTNNTDFKICKMEDNRDSFRPSSAVSNGAEETDVIRRGPFPDMQRPEVDLVLIGLSGDELLERNNIICSQAIKRAVSDASYGEFASAIETLVTAISLIRGSKVAKENRCQVLISSLQDTLEGIELRSYGRQRYGSSSVGKEKHIERSRSPVSIRRYSSERQYDDCKERSGRRRTWDDRERGYRSSDASEKDCHRSKVSRGESSRDRR